MRSPVWIWQFNTDYPPSGSSITHQGRMIPVIGPNDEAAPICGAYVKTHDGVYWMGDIYDHRLAPRLDNLRELQSIYFNQGIEFTPWCVPKGHWPIEEALLAKHVLRATNRLILDVEPYQWFWTGPWANLHPYMQYIREEFPNAWIGLSFDPRYGQYDKYAAIHFGEWLPYVDALLPQDYWETFGVDAGYQIGRTTARIEGCGKEIIHAIPGHAQQSGFDLAVRTILGYGNRFSIWRRGTYATHNAALVETIQEVPEEDPCADLVAEVERLKNLLAQSDYNAERHLKRIRRYEETLHLGAQSLRTTADTLEREVPYNVREESTS